jgi:hypothetical protein
LFLLFKKTCILVNGKPYEPTDSQKGLRNLIWEMFAKLSSKQGNYLEHVTAIYNVLSNKNPKTVQELTLTGCLYYCDRYGNHVGTELKPEALKSVRAVIGLIMWLKNEDSHFKEDVNFMHALRTCMICGTVQHGSIIGQNNIPPYKPIPEWPAKNCFNPKCLSHKIEKMIDPEYKIPKESTGEEKEQDEIDRMLQAVVSRTKRSF